ncbi:MAG: acetyltransferase [Betaproteobacteria bacterium]
MTHFDVFNGDADGICALQQLRLASPLDSSLITGVKRDIELLARVPAQDGDHVTVLDISLDRNRNALLALLERGAHVEYFDHHFAGDIPQSDRLRATIETAPDVCTSLLVDRHLAGRHRLWAIVAAFGDNLSQVGYGLGQSSGLAAARIHQLRDLGESINYNAYGDSEADLFIPPAKLYEALRPFDSPFDFIAGHPVVEALAAGRRRDMELALEVQPVAVNSGGAAYLLPDVPWARRVHGTFANHLAKGFPGRAHAVLTMNAQGNYTVSVRAPLDSPSGADLLCRQFATGGGRVAAAGINELPVERLPEFTRKFDAAFPSMAAIR